jgi:broad specificity phosphatase PhoE
VTSPLQRARQTADAIAAAFALASGGARLEVEVDQRYVELDYGELDEMAPHDLPAGLWERWRSDDTFRPPGGETLGEVAARVATACEEIASEATTGDVLVVSHVSPIKAAVAWALGAGAGVSWRLSLGVASITRVRTGGAGGPALVSFNETAHLAPFFA